MLLAAFVGAALLIHLLFVVLAQQRLVLDAGLAEHRPPGAGNRHLRERAVHADRSNAPT